MVFALWNNLTRFHFGQNMFFTLMFPNLFFLLVFPFCFTKFRTNRCYSGKSFNGIWVSIDKIFFQHFWPARKRKTFLIEVRKIYSTVCKNCFAELFSITDCFIKDCFDMNISGKSENEAHVYIIYRLCVFQLFSPFIQRLPFLCLTQWHCYSNALQNLLLSLSSSLWYSTHSF